MKSKAIARHNRNEIHNKILNVLVRYTSNLVTVRCVEGLGANVLMCD